jgi:hypothetical protein
MAARTMPTRPNKVEAAPKATRAPARKRAASPLASPPAKPVAAPETKPKQKLVRDSFTIPKNEYAVLAVLKQRGLGLGHPVKKSELLRAGIAALQAMPDEALILALRAVPSLKTGRPKDGDKR